MSTTLPHVGSQAPAHLLAMLQAENRILELATRHTPLADVLNELALAAEQLAGRDVLCSILLLDPEQGRLLHGAAPHLPKAYNAAIHGIQIGPEVGSCGTAAARAMEVVVSDIATHPFWAPFKDLALGHGLRACWSTPIFSSTGAVLGTFAMYYREPAEPDALERETIQLLTKTAALVLERARLNDDLTRKIGEHQRTEALLRTAQRAARIATWSWNAADDSLSFAPGSAEILPQPLETVSTRERLLRLMSEEHRQAVSRVFLGAVEHGNKFTAEFAVNVLDETRWLMLSGSALPLDNPLGSSAVGVCFDITDRKEAELGLESSQKSFHRAQEAANIGSWTWDIPTGRIEYSVAVPTLEGLSGNINDWLEHIEPEDLPAVQTALGRAMNGGEFSIEARIRVKKEAAPRWILSTGRVEVLAGQPVSAAGITMDITEKRLTEAERTTYQDRFRLVLESSDIGFWYCDLPFDELIWDAKVKEHFWFAPEDRVTIDDFYARLHPEDREMTRAAIAKSNMENSPYDIDYRTVHPTTGEVKWIRAVGRTTLDAQGKPIRFDGITIDFTDRKRAEEALRASEKLAATGRLAATIAHEINNPLEAVTNFIYLAKNSRDLPANVQRYLDVADRELARVSHIAQQTLGFYRDTSHPARVDVATLLDDVLLLYERKLGYKCLDVQRRYKPGLYVHGLTGELRQVLSNLLANAVDACGDEAKIFIRAKSVKRADGEREIRLVMADEGSGMSPEVQKRLFTPFFTTKREVGTGLGLWVTKGIIDKHQGTMRVRSRTGKNSGTIFRIILPSKAVIAGTRSEA